MPGFDVLRVAETSRPCRTRIGPNTSSSAPGTCSTLAACTFDISWSRPATGCNEVLYSTGDNHLWRVRLQPPDRAVDRPRGSG